MKTKDQHLRVAKQERIWAAQALRDAKYNRAQGKRCATQGNMVLARNYQQEARWDEFWASRRQKIANRQEKYK